MIKAIQRGDIYYAALDPIIGSEQGGSRPVLIIQNNVGNKHSPTVIVAAISSKTGIKARLPTHYFLEPGHGLEKTSLVLLEQLRTVDKRRLAQYIGTLEEEHIPKINHALAVSIGLIEPMPNNKLVLTLCAACVNNFYGTDAFYVRRVQSEKQEKSSCTYCNMRQGFDYEVSRKFGR